MKQTVITPIPSHEQIFDDASKFPPLPLFLKDGHYKTLKLGNNSIPMSWHHNPTNSHWDAGNARGGVKSYSSWLPGSESASACDVKSYRSWLPASSSKGSATAKAVPIVDADVDCSRKKSFRSWLPSSTASFSACAKGSSASSTKNIDVKRPQPAKKSKVRKPLTKKERLIRREGIKKDFAMKPHSWRCPQCQALLSGTYGSVNSSRLYHWKTKHPELPVTTIQRSAPTVVSVSHELPADQRMWSCPLCDAGLPFLSKYDRYKAVQHHIQECHKGETMQSLYNKQRSSFKKPAVALKQTQKFAAKRAKNLRGHAPIRLEPTERMKKTKKRNFYYIALSVCHEFKQVIRTLGISLVNSTLPNKPRRIPDIAVSKPLGGFACRKVSQSMLRTSPKPSIKVLMRLLPPLLKLTDCKKTVGVPT